jgi:hypothetical protein
MVLQSWQKVLWTARAEIQIPSLANIYVQDSNYNLTSPSPPPGLMLKAYTLVR